MKTHSFIYGIHVIQALLQENPEEIQCVFIQQNRQDQPIQKILSLALQHKVEIQRVAKDYLDQLLKHDKHQGVVGRINFSRIWTEDDFWNLFPHLQQTPLLLILDQVQDPHNLGACLRSADASGVHAVIVSKDNTVGLTPVVRKVASGAAGVVPFIQVKNLVRFLDILREKGVWIIGMTGEASQSLYEMDLTGAVAIVMGAEGKGLRRLTKKHCDYLVSIPMAGLVSSLNVSVAAGVALFETVRQRTK